MPDTVLHTLTTERGTYRLVSPRDGFAYVMKDSWKLGEIHTSSGGWEVALYPKQFRPDTLLDVGRLTTEFEASYLARV